MSKQSQSKDPKKTLRLVLMGTGPFAVPSFEALRRADHDIALVVTKPAPPVKSRKGPPPAPVRAWAVRHHLPIFDPLTINAKDAIERTNEVGADLLVVCDYGQILKPDALAVSALGGINLHGSLLPAYRGAAPVQWALLSCETVTGVSVIHMTPRLDGGPVLCTRKTEIIAHETAGELEQRLSEIGVDATLQAIEILAQWDGVSAIGTKQDPSAISKAPRLAKADGDIDWGRSAREVDCHVRGMQPWPIAFSHLSIAADKPPLRLAIKEIGATDIPSVDKSPGEIDVDNGFFVATGDRMVEIKRLQPAGKREMAGDEFIRGHQPPPGTRLFSP